MFVGALKVKQRKERGTNEKKGISTGTQKNVAILNSSNWSKWNVWIP